MSEQAKSAKTTQGTESLPLTPERMVGALRTLAAASVCQMIRGPGPGELGAKHDANQLKALENIVLAIERMAVDQRDEQTLVLAAQVLVPGLREAYDPRGQRGRKQRPFPPGFHFDWQTDWALLDGSPDDQEVFCQQRISQAWQEIQLRRPDLAELPQARAAEFAGQAHQRAARDFDALVFDTAAQIIREFAHVQVTGRTLKDYRDEHDAHDLDQQAEARSSTSPALPSSASRVQAPPDGDFGLFFRASNQHFPLAFEMVLLRAFGAFLDYANDKVPEFVSGLLRGRGPIWTKQESWLCGRIAHWRARGKKTGDSTDSPIPPNPFPAEEPVAPTILQVAGGAAARGKRVAGRTVRATAGAKVGKKRQEQLSEQFKVLPSKVVEYLKSASPDSADPAALDRLIKKIEKKSGR